MTKEKNSLHYFFSNYAFIGSFDEVELVPKAISKEYCILGKSNVGKSSLINSITRNKKLAKVSKTPGRTRHINVFNINKKIYLVDLPGYGYAKFSIMQRERTNNLLRKYLKFRRTLNKVYLLIDTKIGIKNKDIDFIELLIEHDRNFSIVLTKADKQSTQFTNNQKDSIISLLKNFTSKSIDIFITSSNNNIGINNIQKDIYKLTL